MGTEACQAVAALTATAIPVNSEPPWPNLPSTLAARVLQVARGCHPTTACRPQAAPPNSPCWVQPAGSGSSRRPTLAATLAASSSSSSTAREHTLRSRHAWHRSTRSTTCLVAAAASTTSTCSIRLMQKLCWRQLPPRGPAAAGRGWQAGNLLCPGISCSRRPPLHSLPLLAKPAAPPRGEPLLARCAALATLRQQAWPQRVLLQRRPRSSSWPRRSGSGDRLMMQLRRSRQLLTKSFGRHAGAPARTGSASSCSTIRSTRCTSCKRSRSRGMQQPTLRAVGAATVQARRRQAAEGPAGRPPTAQAMR